MSTCGEVLVKLLEAYGVELIFGIPGAHTLESYRGMPDTQMQHHPTPRTRRGLVGGWLCASDGQAGRLFIVTGPGMTNIATAMGQAYADSVPMLVVFVRQRP